MSLVVGLTGGIGCGKSTVAGRFATLGAGIVDTDLIARALTASGGDAMSAIRQTFGADFVLPDGSLDRIRMRQHVFTDATARKKLESLLHPLIHKAAKQQLARLAPYYSYLLLVVPLLARSPDFRQLCDRILVVDCNSATQLARIMQRDTINKTEANAIIAAQTPRDAQLALADDVIRNDGPGSALETQIEALDRQYRQTNY